MRFLLVLFVLIESSLVGCDFPGILNSDDQTARDSLAEQADNLLVVETTGGIAGVNRLLQVDDSGRATFTDQFHTGAQWVIRLSGAELDSLVALFTSNDFFELADEYIDPQVADAFHYAISFTDDQQTKTVRTDRFAAPQNLQQIIDGILELEERIKLRTLALQLKLSAEHISVGEKVNLTLIVRNQSESPVRLRFSSGQIFDFFARRADTVASAGPLSDLVWNWAHDKFFTLATQQVELGANETRSYQITWDGRDNQGDPLVGEFLIGAELVSIPGGRTPQQRLTISNEPR